MHSFAGAGRSWSVGIVVFAASITTACNAPSVNSIPTDAATAIGAFVSNAQDAKRASDSLGWGSKVPLTKLASKPADLGEFKSAICDPPFFDAAIAARTFKSFNEDVATLAKSPDDSLGSYIKALNEHSRQLAEIAANAKPPADYRELHQKLIEKCGPLVERDLAIGSVQLAVTPIAAIDAILALAKFVTSVVALAESRARAEVVKAYVLAHEAEVRQALSALAESKDAGLAAALQSTRTYYVRRAFAGYSDLGELRASSVRLIAPAIGAADDYAQFVAKYLKLQNVDATKLLDDKDSGLRPAYDKFIVDIKQPNADPYAALDNFLGFLKAVSDINSNRQDYLKALKDMESGGS